MFALIVNLLPKLESVFVDSNVTILTSGERSQSHAQLFVACSTVKWGGSGTFPRLADCVSGSSFYDSEDFPPSTNIDFDFIRSLGV